MQSIRTALWVVSVFVLWLSGYLIIAAAAALLNDALPLLHSTFGDRLRPAQYLEFLIGVHQFLLLIIVAIMLVELVRALWRWAIQPSETESSHPETPLEQRGAGGIP
ncbi:MAG: hypothetical protein N2651_07025 [Fimbriimonadales bacterium]|nr:hypothetical protein [Fimbriimonadales bacterium]